MRNYNTTARCLSCLLLLILFVSACISAPEQTPLMKEVGAGSTLSAIKLRFLLNEFVVQFSSRTEAAADEIMALKPSSEVRRSALLWKIHAIPASFRSASLEDPMAAVIDSWILSKQIVHFFESGAGKDLFEKNQDIVLEAVKIIEREIYMIASSAGANEEGLLKVDKWAESQAVEYPLENLYFARRSFLQSFGKFMDKSGAGAFKPIVKITESVSILKDLLIMYAENLPNQARWQAELLLIDLKATAVSAELKEGLSNVADFTSQLADISQDLPEKLEAQKAALMDDLHREWALALRDVDTMRIDTLEHITGERMAITETLDKELGRVLEQITAEREAAMKDIVAVSLRISEEVAKKGNETADRLLMKAFWLAVALAVIVFVLVMVGAAILRKGRQEKA